MFITLNEVFSKYASKSDKFAIQAYSQSNKPLNKIIVDEAPKDKN